jgi:hypothetical protein
MSILNEKMARFKALITVGSFSYDPSSPGILGSESAIRGNLNSGSLSFSLGSDILMSAETGIFSNVNGLAKSSGLYNLAQSITHRLMTTRGTMPGFPTFGIPWDKYIGSTYRDKSIVLANLEFDIRGELSKETRILSIDSFSIRFDNPTTISTQMSITPVNLSINSRNDSSILINLTGGV